MFSREQREALMRHTKTESHIKAEALQSISAMLIIGQRAEQGEALMRHTKTESQNKSETTPTRQIFLLHMRQGR